MIIALEIGLLYAVMALGVYLTYRVLDFPDLTVDGSFTTGAATCAILIVGGAPIPLAMAAGVKVKSMPFSGAVAAVTAVLGGHIQAAVASPAELLTHVRAGNMKAILVMEDARIEQYPDAMTPKELGIDFSWSSWKGIVAPKGLPKDVRAKLVAAIDKALHDETYIAKMNELGEFLDYRDSDKYAALARHDSEIAEKVIRALGMYGMNAKK